MAHLIPCHNNEMQVWPWWCWYTYVTWFCCDMRWWLLFSSRFYLKTICGSYLQDSTLSIHRIFDHWGGKWIWSCFVCFITLHQCFSLLLFPLPLALSQVVSLFNHQNCSVYIFYVSLLVYLFTSSIPISVSMNFSNKSFEKKPQRRLDNGFAPIFPHHHRHRQCS